MAAPKGVAVGGIALSAMLLVAGTAKSAVEWKHAAANELRQHDGWNRAHTDYDPNRYDTNKRICNEDGTPILIMRRGNVVVRCLVVSDTVLARPRYR